MSVDNNGCGVNCNVSYYIILSPASIYSAACISHTAQLHTAYCILCLVSMIFGTPIPRSLFTSCEYIWLL